MIIGSAMSKHATRARPGTMLRLLAFVGLALQLLLSSPAFADDYAECNATDELLKTDPGRAVAACSRLAAQGNPVAEYNLGLMYLAGQGVARDYSQAASWFHKAADQGDAPAQFNLGLMAEEGRGARQDLVEAAKWYRKAAEQGYVYAQDRLGFMYGTGEGVVADPVQAYLWLSLAAAAGDEDASAYRDVVAAGMAREQILEAERLVNQWKLKEPGGGLLGY